MTSLPPGAIAQSGFAHESDSPEGVSNNYPATVRFPSYKEVGLNVVLMGVDSAITSSISGTVLGQDYHLTGSY